MKKSIFFLKRFLCFFSFLNKSDSTHLINCQLYLFNYLRHLPYCYHPEANNNLSFRDKIKLRLSLKIFQFIDIFYRSSLKYLHQAFCAFACKDIDFPFVRLKVKHAHMITSFVLSIYTKMLKCSNHTF